MTEFLESTFPAYVSEKAEVTTFRTATNVETRSGFHTRSTVFDTTLRRYDVSSGIQTFQDLYDTLLFWYRVRGPLIGFRFSDPLDFSSGGHFNIPTPSDQNIGTGDGSVASFQLRKGYTSGSNEVYRIIQKPVTGSVRIAVGGVETTDFSIDYSSGIVTLDVPPQSGEAVTAGFLFDVPVKFEDEFFPMSVTYFEGGNMPSIMLAEVIL